MTEPQNNGHNGFAERSGDAAVALIVNDGRILLIKRASRDDDPWSGQIALPGGFVKDSESSREAVIREVFEETNLEIYHSQLKRELEVVHPMRRSQINVHPFLFEVDDFNGAKPGPEVADIKIARFEDMTKTTEHPEYRGALLYEGWVIWGMTYRILDRFILENGSGNGYH